MKRETGVGEWLGIGGRVVLERLRRLGREAGVRRRARGASAAEDPLEGVHREHVASLLTALLASRVAGQDPPAEVSLEAIAGLAPAVDRWGLAAEVALLTSEPSPLADRRIGEALLRLSPTPARRALVARSLAGAGPA